MQQSRKQVRELRAAARAGDVEAIRLLLAHSVTLGHRRLSTRRYLFAKALGASDLDQFRQFGQDAARRMKPDEVLRIAGEAARFASMRKESSLMSSRAASMPFILSWNGVKPQFATEPRLAGEGSSVLGRVTIGSYATLAADTVIRLTATTFRSETIFPSVKTQPFTSLTRCIQQSLVIESQSVEMPSFTPVRSETTASSKTTSSETTS
jgi:hypothetical protein